MDDPPRTIGNAVTEVEVTLRSEFGGAVRDAVVALPGSLRERFQLGRVLGSGAMGMVVEAHETETDRAVAIKFHRRLGGELLARFVREAQLLERIEHPNLVRVRALPPLGETPVIVMELLPGGTLRERMRRGEGMPVRDAVPLVLDLLAGLQALHEHGVVHRDLKPENLLFGADGLLKITDLGIAKDYGDAGLTGAGQVIGTPLYMAPEQVRGEAPSVGTDIYAVGVILFELLAGRPPFTGPRPTDLLKQHLDAPPPSLSALAPVPERLAALVTRMLAKRVAERPGACADLAVALRHAVPGLKARASPEPARPATPPAAAPEPAATAWQVLMNGALAGVLSGEALVLGRSPHADIVVDDAQLSREHARLSLVDGRPFIEDLNSRNGTWIGGQRVSTAAITRSTTVRVGAGLLTVKPHRGPVPPPPQRLLPVASLRELLDPMALIALMQGKGSLEEAAGVALDSICAAWRLRCALLLRRPLEKTRYDLVAARPERFASGGFHSASLELAAWGQRTGPGTVYPVTTADQRISFESYIGSYVPVSLPLMHHERQVGILHMEFPLELSGALAGQEGHEVFDALALLVGDAVGKAAS